MKRINQSRLVLAPLLVLLAHCGSGGGAKATAPNPAVGNDGGAAEGGDDAGSVDTDAGVESTGSTPTGDGGGACVAEAGAGDPPDDMGIDTNCDGADGIIGKDVYVDPTSGEDTNDGKPTTPMLSLTAALKLATSRGGSVLVAAGTPTDATLSAPGTWAIYGGYGPAFIGPVTRSLTTLAPPSTGLFVDQAASAHIAHMTVQALTPSATGTSVLGADGGAGVVSLSAHALRSNVAHLELDDMVLQAPQGADGTAGAPGVVGLSGNGTNRCNLPASSYGVTDGTSPDGVTLQGNVAAKVGAKPATTGYPGIDGNDAPATLSLVAGVVCGSLGGAGQADGTPGYGGASGGDGSWNDNGKVVYFVSGTGGTGGCPGAGGLAGTSAGSSVALAVLSGTAVITRSSLQAGLGGTGGDGGAGGLGGVGQLGSPPQQSAGVSLPATCASANGDVMQMNCAAYGGQGGSGGPGGAGGGGAGGWSIGVLTASGATVSLDAVTTVVITKAGVGGIGSQGSRGPSGEAHVTYGMP